MLLAIDTSTSTSSIALYEGQVLAERTWSTRRNHTAELLPEVQAMLQRAGLGPAGLTGIAVAVGPGSFNGVRVGVATAKALAVALAVPIAGISSLEVLAYPHFAAAGVVRPLLDAGRGRFSTALFERRGEEWAQTEEPRVIEPADLQTGLARPTLFCGDLRPGQAAELVARWGDLATVATPAGSLRRAGYLAELGWQKLGAGMADDPASLVAVYLSRPALPVAG